MKSLYLILHICTVSFPLSRSFEPRIAYASKWKTLFPAILITASFFLLWDILFTQACIWGFNEAYLIGPHYMGLPLEEWLFFLTVPFASIFIYECVKFFLPDRKGRIWTFRITFILGMALIILGFASYEHLYTCVAFSLAGILLVTLSVLKPIWISHFWIAYLIHLIPFILMNGFLTGAFTLEPVVWYNNYENLKLRLFTIPIEDTAYALILLLMNIGLFEQFNQRYPSKTGIIS